MAKVGETDPRWIVEERTDGANVNNWHWTEKNCLPWSKQRISQLFENLVLYSNEGDEVKINKVEHVKGEANINTRKGKVFHFYELDLKFSWEGQFKGEKVEGSIQFPEVSFEYNPDEYEFDLKCKTGPSEVKNAIKNVGLVSIRKNLQNFLNDFLAQKGELRESKSKALSPQQELEKKRKEEQNEKLINMEFEKALSSSSSSSQSSSMQGSETLNLTVNFRARPSDIWESLLDPRRVSAYTQSEAILNPSVGQEFSLLGGRITGKFLELQENEKIVQKWRLASWPKDHYSTVTFKFTNDSDGMQLALTQTNIPEQEVSQVRGLWMEQFFERIKIMFGFSLSLSGMI